MSEKPGLLRRIDDTHALQIPARLLLGVVFIVMAWNKVVAPGDFLKVINEYRMVPTDPPQLLNLIAIIVPWLEILCGVLLIAGVAVRGVAVTLLVMLVGFTGVVIARAVGIYMDGDIAFCDIKFDCGCGAGEEWICQKVPKNLGLMLLTTIVLASRSRLLCLRGDLFGGPKAGGTERSDRASG